MVNSFIARKDLDSEMTVVRNEFEIGREQPGPHAAAEDAGHDVPAGTTTARRRSARAADIENVDIPRLQAFYRQLLPARQRDADRLRQVRRARRCWAGSAQYFGPLPKPTRTLPPTYTLDPAAGRRAHGHAAPRRRHAADLSPATTCRPARTRTSPRSSCCRWCSATRPAAGCTSGWSRSSSPRAPSASPGAGRAGRRCSSAPQLAPGQDVDKARDDDARDGRVARHASRSRPRSSSARGAVAQRLGPGLHRPRAGRRRAVRGDRAGRLAAVLPAAATESASSTLADVQRVARAPAAATTARVGLYLPTDAAAARAGAGEGRRRRAGQGLQGRPGRGAGRGLRRHAGQHRRPHPALRARQRHEGRAAAQGHARPGGAGAAAPALRRRASAERPGDGGRASRRRCSTRAPPA